jgi:hypothetical protein
VDERLELAGDAAPVCRRRVSSVVGPRALIKEVQRWSGGGRSPGGNTQRVRAARAMATTTTASLGQRADGHAFEAVGSFALLLRVGPNKPMLPTAPTSLTPAPSSPSPSRPLPARPSTTSLSASLPAAARASLYHVALHSSLSRVLRVPPPLRAPQFSRPLPARPATTSRFAVLSAASRAFFLHIVLQVPFGSVPNVPSPSLMLERNHAGWRARKVRRARDGCGLQLSARAQTRARGGLRSARIRGGAGSEARGRTARGAREDGAREDGRTTHGARARGDGGRCVGPKDQGARRAWTRGLTGARARWWDRVVVAMDAGARAGGGVRTARAPGGARGEERGSGDGKRRGDWAGSRATTMLGRPITVSYERPCER